MPDQVKWTLQVIAKKGGVTYRVSNGKAGFNVPQSAVCFRADDATDGCEVNVETKGGQPAKVTIPGKAEAQPRPIPPPITHGGFRGRQDDRGHRGGPPAHHGGRPAGGGSRPQRDDPPRRDATAPYNFVTAELPLGFADESSEQRYSGTIACTGEALTPLLVASAQDREGGGHGAVPERRFFTVDGQPVIPGSSLKGMIRSAVEALSRAPMRGLVSDTTIGTRSVSEPESGYSVRFKTAVAENRLRAGFLQRRGADSLITPCEYVRVRLPELDLAVGKASPARQIAEQAQRCSRELRVRFTIGADADQDRISVAERPRFADAGPLLPGMLEGRLVPTGGMPTQRGTKDKGYIFFPKANPEPHITIEDAVVQAFEDQCTKSQDGLLAFYGKNNLMVPVFYLVEDGEVVAFGLCKYFRVTTRHSPAEIASHLPDDAPGPAMSDLLFGSAGVIARRGRVRCSIGTFGDRTATERFPPRGGVVAGNPAASAVTMYLVQDDDRTICRGRRNRYMITYDDDRPVLRGRKLYWHRHSVYAPAPPNDNANVQAVYHPLSAGCRFGFTVSFERLTRDQLGALCEAVDFPNGHAHKLGLGKPFGLGSVRVTVDWSRTRISADRDHYASLSRRLRSLAAGDQSEHAADTDSVAAIAKEAREAFHSAVVAADRTRGRFEELTHVRQFRALTNWERPAAPAAVVYMKLSDRDGPTATYADRPILDTPGGVPRHDGR